MKIYTSYFGNYKNFPKDVVPIGITRFPPKGMLNLYECAPSERLLKKYKNKEIDEFVFAVYYTEELKNRFGKQQKLIDLFKKVGGGKDVVLCCYEKTGEFCHRQILRDWLKKVVAITEI